jgi:predicted nucleic acid-binding protein
VLQQRGEGQALQAVALMQQGQIVDLTAAIALTAAKASFERRLPMADSIMLITAQTHGATFWTQDADFDRVEGVKYVARK